MRRVLRSRRRPCTAVLALLFITAAGVPACQPDADSTRIEELLGQMAEFLATHGDFAFEALVTYEVLQESGQTLQFELVQRVAVSQPDRMFWVTLQDDGSANTVWFSDGLFTMLKQPENIYGEIRHLGAIPDMIDVVVNEYGIVVPFSDLLAGGDEPVLLRDVESSSYAGLAWVDGGWTHHLALRNELVDYQVWIREDGEPVPQRLVITWKQEEGRPSYVARFRKWKFSPSFDESQFRFVAPPDAERIEVIPVSPATEAGY